MGLKMATGNRVRDDVTECRVGMEWHPHPTSPLGSQVGHTSCVCIAVPSAILSWGT